MPVLQVSRIVGTSASGSRKHFAPFFYLSGFIPASDLKKSALPSTNSTSRHKEFTIAHHLLGNAEVRSFSRIYQGRLHLHISRGEPVGTA